MDTGIEILEFIGRLLLLSLFFSLPMILLTPKKVAEKSSWYNNGEKNKFLQKGKTIPKGFSKGRLRLSEEEPFWCNNGKKEIELDPGQKIPEGFIKGELTEKGKAEAKAAKEKEEYARAEYNAVLGSFKGRSIALLSKVAKVNGEISQAEAKYLSEILNRISKKSPQDREIYKKIIEKEKNNIDNIDLHCKNLLPHIRLFGEIGKLSFIEDFVGLGYAYGHYDKDEEKIILKIIHNLNIDIQLYQKVRETFEVKQGSKQKSNQDSKQKSKSSDSDKLSLDECYKVLKSSKTDSLLVIKKNYRHLVRQYHYDSITSKDLPQDMMNFAEERVKLLNGAYERVRKVKS